MGDNYDRLIDLYPSPNAGQASPDLLHNNAGFIGTNEQFLNALGVIASRKGTDGIIAAVALEQLASRADLADPSAPAEIEGLLDRAGTAFANYFCRNYPGPDIIISNPDWHATRLFAAATREMSTALTALQADNERLRLMERDTYATWKKVAGDLQARAEKAEAERNAWKANAEALAGVVTECTRHVHENLGRIYGSSEGFGEVRRIGAALAAHEKLKGDV